jgi:hypothetical protein
MTRYAARMDYKVFEGRVLELLFKTDDRITPQLAAYKIGVSVEEARTMLEKMATHDIVSMESDDNGSIYFDLVSRPPPTRQPLSWQWNPGNQGHQVAPRFAPQPMMMVPVYRPMVPVAYLPQEKSVGGAIALSFFFGPLGMLYSTVTGAMVMFFAGFLFTLATLGLGIFLVWPGCVLWSALAASQHNERVRAQSNFLLAQQQMQHMQMQQHQLAQRSVTPPG